MRTLKFCLLLLWAGLSVGVIGGQFVKSNHDQEILESVRQILRDPDSPLPTMEKLPEIARGLRTEFRAIKGLPPL